MGNLTSCKIVTPKNFNLKLCIRDYVGETTHHANFGSNRYTGGFSPYRRNITILWLFFDCPVLSCPVLTFFLGNAPRSNRWTDFHALCEFLLVINSNWHPISYRFGVLAAYCSNFGHFAFSSHPLAFGVLGTTYNVHLGLIGKRVIDFLLMLIELFFARCYGWVATSEKRSKNGDFAPTRSLWSKISGIRGSPHQSFLHY